MAQFVNVHTEHSVTTAHGHAASTGAFLLLLSETSPSHRQADRQAETDRQTDRLQDCDKD